MFALSQIGERADSLVGEINQNILHFAYETRRVVSTNKKKVNNRSRSRGTFCLDFLLLLLLPRSLSRSFSLSSIWRASVRASFDNFHSLPA